MLTNGKHGRKKDAQTKERKEKGRLHKKQEKRPANSEPDSRGPEINKLNKERRAREPAQVKGLPDILNK